MLGLKKFNDWARSDTAYFGVLMLTGFYVLVALYALVQS